MKGKSALDFDPLRLKSHSTFNNKPLTGWVWSCQLSRAQQDQTHGGSLGEVLHVLENTLTNEGLDLVASHEERSVALQVHHPRLRHELTCHTTKARSRHRSHSSEQRLVNAREGREKRSTSLEAVPAAVTLSSHGKK